jgi:hypothetical protein
MTGLWNERVCICEVKCEMVGRWLLFESEVDVDD